MKLLRRTLIALAGASLADSAGRAGTLDFIWSEWETSAVEKRGPEQAGGLLLYFHGSGADDAFQHPIPTIFTEMARIAAWDVLRINRLNFADAEAADDAILSFVAVRIAQARQDGYKRIIVTGYSRGGWLALLTATLPVDAAIGLAPGTGSHTEKDRERTRDLLARILSGARAKRVAAFFFEGDPVEDLSERRAVAIRRGLQQSGSTYMVVDRPPDVQGHGGGGTGRFARRYRDCLLQFVQGTDQPSGEVECSRSSGYAIGSEIGLPRPGPASKPPAAANPAFAPYWGRWEGDDEYGAYSIVESVEVRPKDMVCRVGHSAEPGRRDPPRTWMSELAFRLDAANGCLVAGLPTEWGGYRARLRSATELELEALPGRSDGKGTRSFLLHKQNHSSATP